MSEDTNKEIFHGYIPDEPKDKDFIFGASSIPFELLVPDGDWRPWRPVKEIQNVNGVEPYACVTFTILNAIEEIVYRKYGIKLNLCERFLAEVSGTKKRLGNSPRNVADFLIKLGVPHESIWPFSSDIKTHEEYYAPVPDEVFKIAEEFSEKWDFGYEFVTKKEDIPKAIQSSPLGIAVVAWFKRNGKYYSPEGMRDGHFTLMDYYNEQAKEKEAFDSYKDVDGSVEKPLEWDMEHSVIMRFWVEKKAEKKGFWEGFCDWNWGTAMICTFVNLRYYSLYEWKYREKMY